MLTCFYYRGVFFHFCSFHYAFHIVSFSVRSWRASQLMASGSMVSFLAGLVKMKWTLLKKSWVPGRRLTWYCNVALLRGFDAFAGWASLLCATTIWPGLKHFLTMNLSLQLNNCGLWVVSEMFDIFVYCHPFGFWPGVIGASHCHGHDITYSSFNVNISTFLHIARTAGGQISSLTYVIINFVAARFCAALFHSPIVSCVVFSLDEVPHVERCSHLVSGLGSLEPLQVHNPMQTYAMIN